jgi:phosphatidylinositol glycan class W
MLPLFLLANLLTGAVNFTMDTLAVSDQAARWLLCVYITTVCLCGVLAARAGLRLRL